MSHFTVSLPQGRGVAGDDDELGLALAEGLQGLLVAQDVLAGLHHQGEPGVDGLGRLLLLLLGTHLRRKSVLFKGIKCGTSALNRVSTEKEDERIS